MKLLTSILPWQHHNDLETKESNSWRQTQQVVWCPFTWPEIIIDIPEWIHLANKLHSGLRHCLSPQHSRLIYELQPLLKAQKTLRATFNNVQNQCTSEWKQMHIMCKVEKFFNTLPSRNVQRISSTFWFKLPKTQRNSNLVSSRNK